MCRPLPDVIAGHDSEVIAGYETRSRLLMCSLSLVCQLGLPGGLHPFMARPGAPDPHLGRNAAGGASGPHTPRPRVGPKMGWSRARRWAGARRLLGGGGGDGGDGGDGVRVRWTALLGQAGVPPPNAGDV